MEHDENYEHGDTRSSKIVVDDHVGESDKFECQRSLSNCMKGTVGILSKCKNDIELVLKEHEGVNLL